MLGDLPEPMANPRSFYRTYCVRYLLLVITWDCCSADIVRKNVKYATFYDKYHISPHGCSVILHVGK